MDDDDKFSFVGIMDKDDDDDVGKDLSRKGLGPRNADDATRRRECKDTNPNTFITVNLHIIMDGRMDGLWWIRKEFEIKLYYEVCVLCLCFLFHVSWLHY